VRHFIIACCLSVTFSFGQRVIEKEFGEAHSNQVKGGQEVLYATCVLPDGRVLCGGYKIPACREYTEKVADSYWEKVINPCGPERYRPYLIYLDTSANLIKEKYWVFDNTNALITAIKPFQSGYVTIAEHDEIVTDGFLITVFDNLDSIIIQKFIAFDSGDRGREVQRLRVISGKQIGVQMGKGDYGQIDRKEWLFNDKLNVISIKPVPVAQVKTQLPGEYKKLWSSAPSYSRIGFEIQLPDKSFVSVQKSGTYSKPTLDIATRKALVPEKIFTTNDATCYDITYDPYGNTWLVGLKVRHSFDRNAWVARVKK
jgi:hypothetical protein